MRRIGVYIDYWYAYTSARQLFASSGAPPPPWFGNVSPRAVAGAVVKHPPAGVRRSERVLGGLHVFVRHYDPEVHHGQLERVRRWELEGATVTVGPSREQGGGHWQSSVSVAVASAVVDALARGTYDVAVVFAGDGSLWPMLAMLGGGGGSVELATWVAPDGTVPTALVGLPGIWCHRLGKVTFQQLSDDRRPAQHRSTYARGRSGEPPTAMAAAMEAAGLAEPPAARGEAPDLVAPPATSGAAALQDSAVRSTGEQTHTIPASPQQNSAPTAGRRRLSQRLFGR